MEGYRFKRRARREIQNAQKVTLKNGSPATKGVCAVHDPAIYQIGKT